MTKFGFLLLSIIPLVWGCTPSTTQENEAVAKAQDIYTEAMTLHDEVMPRMGELMQLREELQAQVDSLTITDSIAYADTLQQMQASIQNLKDAEDGMMQWMRSVVPVPGSEATEDTSDLAEITPADTTAMIRTQEAQKEAIVEVKQKMEESIQEANQLLGRPEATE